MARRQFTKGIDLVKHQQKRLEQMKLTMAESVRLMQKLSLGDARELTSGRLTPKQTRGAFARGASAAQRTNTGRKRGRAPMLPINIQSSQLYRSIKARSKGGTGRTGGKAGFDIYSKGATHAKFVLGVGGTSKMVDRGMKKEATRRMKARQMAHVQHFIRKQRSI